MYKLGDICGDLEYIDIFNDSRYNIVKPKPTKVEKWKKGCTYKILLIFTSEKDIKVKPAKEWVERNVRRDFNKLNIVPEFMYMHISTKGPEQPYNDAGMICAWNRMNGNIPSKTSFNGVVNISVESSFQLIPGGGYDVANVIVYMPHSQYVFAFKTSGPFVPEDIIKDARQHGYSDNNPRHGNCTVGSVLSRRYNVPNDDWHIHFCRFKRQDFIERGFKDEDFFALSEFDTF